MFKIRSIDLDLKAFNKYYNFKKIKLKILFLIKLFIFELTFFCFNMVNLIKKNKE